MTEVKQLRIPYADLTTVSIECKQCGAETVVNVADGRQRRAWDDSAAFACPICQARFDSNLKGALIRLRDWYELAKKAQENVAFLIVLHTAGPTGGQRGGLDG